MILEIIDGTDRSTKTSVNRANSIENRLNKLIEYLHVTYPTNGWGQYLASGTNVVWTNIIIAGHSQGGVHATMLAKTRLVYRCLMFASMDWRIPQETPSPPGWANPASHQPNDFWSWTL